MNDTVVIVVSYNTRDLTLQAVASARKAADGLDARVIVADNGSADGTVEAVRAAHLEVHALAPGNRWVRRFYYEDRDLTRDAEVDTVSGSVMMLRAEAFEAVRGFDEGFRMYFEETDLCWRLRDGGHSVAFCPAARAVQRPGASTRQTSVR